jgi:predicted NBD/HSP70 family sugar kinase
MVRLCKMILNIQYTINPDVVVISGGVINNKSFLTVVKKTYKRLLDAGQFDPKGDIRISKYGSDSNILGAAHKFYN